MLRMRKVDDLINSFGLGRKLEDFVLGFIKTR